MRRESGPRGADAIESSRLRARAAKRSRLILHKKRRTVFWPGLAVVVGPRHRNIGVAEPFLDLGDTGLVNAEGRSLAGGGLGNRMLHDLNRVVGDSVLVAEIIEQRRERRQPVTDRRRRQRPVGELIAPCDHMRPRHDPKLLRPLDAGKPHEVIDRPRHQGRE